MTDTMRAARAYLRTRRSLVRSAAPIETGWALARRRHRRH